MASFFASIKWWSLHNYLPWLDGTQFPSEGGFSTLMKSSLSIVEPVFIALTILGGPRITFIP
jgi:hypothetical protein